MKPAGPSPGRQRRVGGGVGWRRGIDGGTDPRGWVEREREKREGGVVVVVGGVKGVRHAGCMAAQAASIVSGSSSRCVSSKLGPKKTPSHAKQRAC